MEWLNLMSLQGRIAKNFFAFLFTGAAVAGMPYLTDGILKSYNLSFGNFFYWIFMIIAVFIGIIFGKNIFESIMNYRE